MKRLRVLRRFHSAYEGNCSPREIIRVRDDRAEHLVEIGVAELLDDKEVTRPFSEKPSPLSRPDQASGGLIHPDSKDIPPSQSTTHGESAPGQDGSMPATPSGGTYTTKKSRRGSRANSGRKTKAQRTSTVSTGLSESTQRASADDPE